MHDQEITTKVIECVAKSLALSGSAIHAESKVIAELGADSLDFMDMIFALEQTFGIRLQKENFNLVAKIGNGTKRSGNAGRKSHG
jgi:acyl carrier protein